MILTFLGVILALYTGPESTIAVGGYDVTTYFFESQPQKGSSNYVYEYEGVPWYFVSQENLEKFKSNPEHFLPEYGGYCVWAISNDRLTWGLPELWVVRDGKLYLLCSEEAKLKWLKDPEIHIDRANERWPAMKKTIK